MSTPDPKAEFFDAQKAAVLARVFGIVGGLALLFSMMLGVAELRQFAFSWLFAFSYFFTLCVGALFWTLVHHATDAQWSVLVRRQLENVAALLPWFLLLFIPVLLCAPRLYNWWDLQPGLDPLLAKKHAFLNPWAFTIRAVVYLCVLSALAYFNRKNSVRQDADGHPLFTIRLRRLAFLGIPVMAFSLTFGAVDWLMSLDYHWQSTMWGVYIFGGGVGAAMSLLVLLVTFLKSFGYLKQVNAEHYHVMGKLMLAFCVFWAYIGFSQYMLMWYANLPEETSYFIRRNTGSWWDLSLFLVIGRFFLPFPFLLFQGTKKNPKWLCTVAGWLLVMQLLDIYIIVLPILHVRGFAPSLLDVTCFLGIGGMLAALFLKNLPKNSLVPVRDPRIEESIHLSN